MASSVAQSSSMHHSSALTRSESQRGAGLALSLGNDPVSLVYAATNLGHTDWEMHVQLCDAINQIPSEGQRIIEAIKSRISSQNLEIAIQSVILLESVVKNCPGILPMLAVGNFMEQLVQALPKRVREPQKKSMIHFTSASKTLKKLEKAEKILLLIRSLAMAFDQNNQNNSPALARWNTADREKMKVFSEVYNTLLRTGVTFPSPAEDENVPIITPAAAPKPTGTSAATRSSPQASSSSDNGGTGNTYTDAECRIAFESCKLLSDMLLDAVHSSAGRSHSELLSSLRSNDIISALVSNIRTAQNQFQIRLLEHQPSETIITQIISVNEIILKVFEFYRAIEDGKTDEKTMKSFALVASEENEAKSGGQVQNSGKSKNGSVNAAQTKAAKRRSKDDDEKKERSPSKPDDQKTSFANLLPLDLLSAPVSEPKKQSLSATANAPLALNPFMIPSAAPANANTLAPAASAHTSRSGGDHTPGSTPPPSPKHKAAMLHEHKPSADAAIDPFLAIATKSASPVATVDSVQPSSSALDSDSPAAGTPATPFDDDAATNTKALYDADVESRAPADDDDPFASIAARK